MFSTFIIFFVTHHSLKFINYINAPNWPNCSSVECPRIFPPPKSIQFSSNLNFVDPARPKTLTDTPGNVVDERHH